MNTSITISFVIGGLLLISILTMNAGVMENSSETVLNMSAKKTVETVTQVMTRDFLRIGYNTGQDPKNAITTAISNSNAQKHQEIIFEADIDTNDSQSPVTITWEAHPDKSIESTSNPNDYKLTRTVNSGPEQGTITFAVTEFKFIFLDVGGNVTTDKEKIKSIQVSMSCEAPSKYGNHNTYEKSVWDKTFIPPNLNLSSYNETTTK